MPDDASPRKVAENGLSSSLLRTVTQTLINLIPRDKKHSIFYCSTTSFFCLTRSVVLVIFVVELFNADLANFSHLERELDISFLSPNVPDVFFCGG